MLNINTNYAASLRLKPLQALKEDLTQQWKNYRVAHELIMLKTMQQAKQLQQD